MVFSLIIYWCVNSMSELLAGVEKSGKNAEGDSWWETWQEVLHQDEWRSISYPSICQKYLNC